MICPHCHKQISQAEISAHLGRMKSKAKSDAARTNGKKGGRPRTPTQTQNLSKRIPSTRQIEGELRKLEALATLRELQEFKLKSEARLKSARKTAGKGKA